MTDPPILAEGLLLEQIGPILYRATLPNGKEVIAHLSKPLTDAGAVFETGTRVQMELTPYDFDIARITGTSATHLGSGDQATA
jgi:translation initiation factor IF-1